jgi:hypothetical protein
MCRVGHSLSAGFEGARYFPILSNGCFSGNALGLRVVGHFRETREHDTLTPGLEISCEGREVFRSGLYSRLGIFERKCEAG